ncbi:MAG: hypothetical protein M0R75_13605 [Dehalococcoidia bacterium]|nr:hypothetical protein [Dehalococcoidia bacterium]
MQSDPTPKFTVKRAAAGGARWSIMSAPRLSILIDFVSAEDEQAERLARAVAAFLNRRCWDCGAEDPAPHLDTCPHDIGCFEPIDADAERMICPACHKAAEVLLLDSRPETYGYAGFEGEDLQFSYDMGSDGTSGDGVLQCQSCGFESPSGRYSFDLV